MSEKKDFIRLVHPETGDFIAEYYPLERKLVVTKHKQTANIFLNKEDEKFYAERKITT